MEKFQIIISTIAPFMADNVDTDQIIPARFLTVTDKAGLAENLFVDLRYTEDKKPKPDFFLNRSEYRGARILLAHENFGCGSSREHAPWAILGDGFKAVIAISFADIFQNNALKNGLMPIALSSEIVDQMHGDVATNPNEEATISLTNQSVVWKGKTYNFELNPFSKKCLLEGLDDIGYTISFSKQITDYEKKFNQTINS